MNKIYWTWIIGLLWLILLVGCGQPGQEVTFDSHPLTIEEWNQLQVEEKYELATLERLRANDSKLKSEHNWGVFMRKVVVPQRKLDIPSRK